MRRWSFRTALLFLATGVLACDASPAQGPVVGFAYTAKSRAYLELAREGLLARAAAPVTFLFDTARATETSDGALTFAAGIVGRSDVAIVVGPSNSRHALATAPAYNAAGLAQILPSATSRRLRASGPATFVLVPDDSVEGEYMARFAWQQLGARRALIFYANDEYGEGLRAGIQAGFTALGGTVLEAVPTAEEMDYDAVVTSAQRRHHPDVFFSAGRGSETGQLLRAARTSTPAPPVVAGDGAYLLPSLERGAGRDLRGLFVTAFWVYDSSRADHRAFADRVRRILHSEPTPEDALTEDALVLAATARTLAGPDRGAVRRWLAGLGRDHPPFEGITGPIAFGPGRQLPLAMVQFTDGRAQRVPDSLVAPRPQP